MLQNSKTFAILEELNMVLVSMKLNTILEYHFKTKYKQREELILRSSPQFQGI